jgi:hypothetical protein
VFAVWCFLGREVVCAGSLEPFEVYVWALQTGRLLDVLAGHGGPVIAMDYALTQVSYGGLESRGLPGSQIA